jgi:plastocyanin
MPHRLSSVGAALVVLLAFTVGCERNGSTPEGSSTTPLSPSAVAPNSPTASAGGASTAATAGLPDRNVTMMDACDPDTFNAPPPAGVGPGTCVRSGGVQFATFLELLGKHGAIGSWRFAPADTSATVGQVFVATNRGGEVHTFTEVEAFGGGIVPPLNALSHNPVIAPECASLDPDDFVAPGGTYREEPLEDAGTARFQCCIHPWMRLEVKVAAK